MARRLSFSSSSSSSSSYSSPPSSAFSSFPSSSSSGHGRNRAAADAIVAGWKPYVPSLRTASSSWSKNDAGGDRFIPVRLPGSAPSLSITKKPLADDDEENPSKIAYRRALADAVLRDRVLTFRTRPAARLGPLEEDLLPVPLPKKQRMTKRRWRVPKVPSRILDIPDMLDHFHLNLLDWGSANVLAVALYDTVSLWDDSKKSSSVLGSADSYASPVTSLAWAPDGRRIAVGLDSSELQLWNSENSGDLLRSLSDVHGGYRVTSLAWKDNNILATSGIEGDVLLHDLRLESSVVQTFHGHRGEVCALKWSGSGKHLAGGGDVDLFIWDASMAASPGQRTPWLYRMYDHTSTVKALAWCPFQSDLLASGGGDGDDCCVKFGNTATGRLLNSVDTGPEVCSLQWSRHERQLISSHGGPRNQLTVWKYPSMAKGGELIGHGHRALFTAQSPDGYTVVSAAPDESLMFWQFSGGSEMPPKVPKSRRVLFPALVSVTSVIVKLQHIPCDPVTFRVLGHLKTYFMYDTLNTMSLMAPDCHPWDEFVFLCAREQECSCI